MTANISANRETRKDNPVLRLMKISKVKRLSITRVGFVKPETVGSFISKDGDIV